MKRAQVIGAWCLLVLSIIGWPISARTIARHEPPTVLGLSWFAITLTALDFLATSRVHRDQEEGSDGKAPVPVVRGLRRASDPAVRSSRARGHRAPRRRAGDDPAAAIRTAPSAAPSRRKARRDRP